MILVGWHGFGSHKLSAEQVIEFALELIGKGKAEQDEVAALLANTDPSEWQTIDRYLEELAQAENSDRLRGLRKWRLAELNHLLEYLRTLDKTYQYPEDELMDVFFVLNDFWCDYDELPDSAAARPEWATPVEELLAEYQAWAKREEVSLWGEMEALYGERGATKEHCRS